MWTWHETFYRNVNMVCSLWHVQFWTHQWFAEMLTTSILSWRLSCHQTPSKKTVILPLVYNSFRFASERAVWWQGKAVNIFYILHSLASYTSTPDCLSKLRACQLPSIVGNTLTVDKYIIQPNSHAHTLEKHFFPSSTDTHSKKIKPGHNEWICKYIKMHQDNTAFLSTAVNK